MRMIVPCLLALLRICAAGAQTPAVLDLAALPPLTPAGRESYEQHFLLGNLPRAFAISSNGLHGGRWGARSAEEARSAALKSCADKGGTNCAIYAEDLDVVWPGRPHIARARPPGPLLAGEGWGFEPDDRYFWQGPAAARGVVVYAHGYSGSAHEVQSGGLQPPPYIRAFNNAGFDVVRFAREWSHDARKDEMAQHLRDGLRDLRRRGWKAVVAAGQSRGAWNTLQALDTPDIADAAIVVSPAANGTDFGSQALLGNPALWIIVHDVPATRTRVAFVQFRDDPYYSSGDQRVSTLRGLQGKAAALLIIDRPEGLIGHGGGGTAAFAERYGGCLLRFATAPVPPTGC